MDSEQSLGAGSNKAGYAAALVACECACRMPQGQGCRKSMAHLDMGSWVNIKRVTIGERESERERERERERD